MKLQQPLDIGHHCGGATCAADWGLWDHRKLGATAAPCRAKGTSIATRSTSPFSPGAVLSET